MSRIVSARIPDALYQQLETAAKALGVSVSGLVAQAIADYVNSVNKAYTADNQSPPEQGSHKLGEMPVNSPFTLVNRAELSELCEHLATLEARLNALEQAVNSVNDGIPKPSRDLADLTVQELRRLAKGTGIPNYWALSKADLIAALR